MASPLLRNGHNSYDFSDGALMNDCDGINECDSGVFSETTISSTQFPIYFTRNGLNSSKNSRQYGFTNPAKLHKRLIKKNGRSNLIRSKIPSLWAAYLRDIGNTIVNSRWRWTIICFASSHVFSWLLFAWFYMLTANDNEDSLSASPCLIGINGFAGYFLFSLETQHTIGYGTRFVTSNCPETVFLLALQMIMGVAICGGMASIVYTKMIRPHTPRITSLFSKTAVICQRDGVLCLIFRVRDENNKHRVATKITAYLIETRNEELHLRAMKLEQPGFLIWPLEVVHPIDSASPFWNHSAKDLITKKFEFVVTLEGASVTTGQCSKIRTSYISNEILWGHRFKPCVMFDNQSLTYYINNVDFNTTEEVATPLCSAQRLDEVVEELNSPISSPFSVGSPVSLRGRNEDIVSLGASSGIGSWREELLTPIVSQASRKLSVIREYKSVENLILGDKNKHFVEIHNSDLLDKTKSSSNIDDYNNIHNVSTELYKVKDEDSSVMPKAKSNQEFDVERLLKNLQNYIEGNEPNDGQGFCETNF